MKYWPLSTIRHSPLMPAMYAWELERFSVYPWTRPPSQAAFYACLNVATNTDPEPMPGLVAIESVNASIRFAYTEYPDFERWQRLERVYIIEDTEGRFCMHTEPCH